SLIIGAALALLGGCSALRIGYGTAPDVVYWWLDGYIDFNDTQTPRVREAIRQWFTWHRRTQVPDYAALLARAQTEVVADTTPARVCEWQADVAKRARVAFERIEPAAADLMLTVTPEQIKYLDQRYAKFNAEFRDDYIQADRAKRTEENLKRTLDRAETLYGRFDDAQRARIAEGLLRSPFDAEVWFAERRQRQIEALQMLRKLTGDGNGAANREQAIAALRVYAERVERSPREPYRRYAERLAEFNCAFGASLHNMTTPAQRRTAAQKLAGWEGDLRAIAAAPVADNGN
ncbi:MAG: hypothetical protein H7Y61_11560, partial [Rhizobiales bacterium]|nr:hypothetical protein [Rhizobacter sp.]